ncbi:DMT family transporter [Spirochaetia bacterium 38H-sp]|uniref:DMT family transporter n=1 Tax=Rarispira pelagica TaxID=3141764 RepID=A0ABU9U8X3_9SPIR
MDKRRLGGLFAIVFAVVLWGVSFVSTKIVLSYMGPLFLAFLRFAVGLVVIFPFLLLKRLSIRVSSKDMLFLAMGGITGVTLYFYFENTGLVYMPASDASLIVAFIPVISAIIESLVYKKKLYPSDNAGIILSMWGVYFVVREGLRLTSSPIGYVLMVLAALSWIAYSFLSRPFSGKINGLVMVFWHFFWGTLAFLPFLHFEPLKIMNFSFSFWFNFLFLSVGCSALAYIAYQHALSVLGVTVSNVFINLIPFITVLTAVIFLEESFTVMKAIGGVLIITGLYLTTGYKKKKY